MSTISDTENTLLQSLPDTGKLSIALDCWTSPFRQAFLAITGYFIDTQWKYREVLLAFEPLEGSHSGYNLSKVLMDILDKYKISDRVIAITTDNASNNNTMLRFTQDIGGNRALIRTQCLAHVIQLCLTDLLSDLKVQPHNEWTELVWSDEHEDEMLSIDSLDQGDIRRTLKKVPITT
jgi:hypothetical protein